MNMYQDYVFFDTMKAEATGKFGENNYLLQHTFDGISELYPPDYVPAEIIGCPTPQWIKDGDKYTSTNSSDVDVWQAVANPGWPLTVQYNCREYHLARIKDDGIAQYTDGRNILYGRLLADGLDVWNSALATRPFPAILGRNYMEGKSLVDALAEKGIAAKETILGKPRDTLSRIEYEIDGKPHVAYEIMGSGVGAWNYVSVVLADPVVQDERDLNWVYRMVTEEEVCEQNGENG
ncbi:MAG: hypothetical protein II967_06265 [Deltaproteobacteria bacterium]|nr:hypothetical protein [Deltaproteobacteria bacterium]